MKLQSSVRPKNIFYGFAIGLLSVGCLPLAAATEKEAPTTYHFSMPNDSGVVKELTITVTGSGKDIVARIAAKLHAGGKEEATAPCDIVTPDKELRCTRDDGGGHFDILTTTDPKGKKAYQLRLKYFSLSDEGETDVVAMKSSKSDEYLQAKGTIVQP